MELWVDHEQANGFRREKQQQRDIGYHMALCAITGSSASIDGNPFKVPVRRVRNMVLVGNGPPHWFPIVDHDLS